MQKCCVGQSLGVIGKVMAYEMRFLRHKVGINLAWDLQPE